jgi:hypothetical protein
MKAVEDIKALINEMMAQEMENFKEAVSCGEEDITMSPGIYTMLQVLMAKIERLPSVWHDPSEKPREGVLTVVCTNGRTVWMAMSYECAMESTKWAYVEDLI